MAATTIVNIPTQASDSAAWISWHKSLKGAFGRKKANEIFLAAWNKRGSAISLANTSELRDYADKNGFVIEGNVLTNITDAGSDVLDFMSDIFVVGKYAALGLGIFLGVATISLAVSIFRNPYKSARTAAAFTPVGRAAIIGGGL